MREECGSQGHEKDTNMFTGEDALNAEYRTRLILDNTGKATMAEV